MERENRELKQANEILRKAPAYFAQDDPQLSQVLAMLEATPGDNRSLAELAKAVHATERTLMRRAQRDLGMSLTVVDLDDWPSYPKLTAPAQVDSKGKPSGPRMPPSISGATKAAVGRRTGRWRYAMYWFVVITVP